MGAAFWLQRGRVPRPAAVLACGIVLFAIAALAEDTGFLNGYAPGARIAYGIPAALIVLGAAEADRSGPIAVPDWLRVLGEGSYSLYLFQFVFIGIAWKLCEAAGLAASLPPAAIFLILSGAAIAGGLLMGRLVEKPLIRFLRHGRPASDDAPKARRIPSARPFAGRASRMEAVGGTACVAPTTPVPPQPPSPGGSTR